VIGDTQVEPNETFTFALSAPVGVTLARPSATGTILNDDSAQAVASISIADARIIEGTGGLTDAVLTVTLDTPAATDVTVDYATVDGTAHAGSDYAATSGSLVFSAGTTSRSMHVPVIADTEAEGDETFHVHLSNALGAAVRDGDALVTIVDDDGPTVAGSRSFIAVAGAAPGAFGSFFRTALQLHNDSDAPASGNVVFHLVSGGTPAVMPYTLAPHETKELDDAALGAGIGSADLIGTNGPAPLAVIHIYSDSACGTVGLTTQSLEPGRDALTAPAHAILLAPTDLGTSRFNIGVRPIGGTATIHFTLRDRSGNVKARVDRQFPADTLTQPAASDLLGVALAADDSVTVEMTAGTALVYGSTTDNTSQDPAIQLARPLP
jgi:hypothetical protein